MELDHVQAAAIDGRICLVGALNSAFLREHVVPHIILHDPAADRLSEGPALSPDRLRGAAMVVAYEGTLYVIGGNWFGLESLCRLARSLRSEDGPMDAAA